MKKKKILFIMESLRIGGAEKSLITILNMLDYSKYDVDLFLFSHTGEFMGMIPEEVNLLDEDRTFTIYRNNSKLAPLKYIAKLDLKRAYHSFAWSIEAGIKKIKKEKLYIGWNHVKYLFTNFDNEYDTSIAFLERKTIYFNSEFVKSKNKIGFIHNDYSVYPYDDKLDRKYFKNYNHIVTVSEHCKEVLKEIFPEYKDKFLVIKNMLYDKLVEKLSEEPIKNYNIDKDYINIVSVGRLVKQKGFDLAINSCNELVKKGYKIHWYIVGEGEERKNLEQQINKLSLNENVILVGADINPYKWMKMADIYVQPSRFEGYGITVAEAKSLKKVIIANDIPEFREILNDNGIYVENNNYEEYIEKYIKKTLEVQNYNENNIQYKELKKLYEIINKEN